MCRGQGVSETSELPGLAISSSDVAAPRPIVAFSGREPHGYYDPPHSHDRAQFSYRVEGFAVVKAGGRPILLAPGRGVWIPAGVVHEVSCRGPAAYNAFYATEAAVPQPAEVRVIEVSPLLQALFESLLQHEQTQIFDAHANLVMRLMLEEILRLPDIGAAVPVLPLSQRLRAICEALRGDPANGEGIDLWAARAGMSRRSFTRTFRDETGMSFGAWRHQLRMLSAMTWIEEGMPLHRVASALGYANVSSFSRAFDRDFGKLTNA